MGTRHLIDVLERASVEERTDQGSSRRSCAGAAPLLPQRSGRRPFVLPVIMEIYRERIQDLATDPGVRGRGVLRRGVIWISRSATYDPTDPGLVLRTAQADPANFVGRVGAFLASCPFNSWDTGRF